MFSFAHAPVTLTALYLHRTTKGVTINMRTQQIQLHEPDANKPLDGTVPENIVDYFTGRSSYLVIISAASGDVLRITKIQALNG